MAMVLTFSGLGFDMYPCQSCPHPLRARVPNSGVTRAALRSGGIGCLMTWFSWVGHGQMLYSWRGSDRSDLPATPWGHAHTLQRDKRCLAQRVEAIFCLRRAGVREVKLRIHRI